MQIDIELFVGSKGGVIRGETGVVIRYLQGPADGDVAVIVVLGVRAKLLPCCQAHHLLLSLLSENLLLPSRRRFLLLSFNFELSLHKHQPIDFSFMGLDLLIDVGLGQGEPCRAGRLHSSIKHGNSGFSSRLDSVDRASLDQHKGEEDGASDQPVFKHFIELFGFLFLLLI